jgi:hypothetical protein
VSYPAPWDRAGVRAVFTTESRQKTRELFLRTHRPFHRIRVDFCKDAGAPGPFATEEQVRAVVQAGGLRADNRLLFVVGEAGSGKSELCQWLEYTADADRSLPIHIPRSMTTAAHVVTLLRQKLGAASPSGALRRAPLATQADYVALSAVVLLYEQDRESLTPADHWAALLGGPEVRSALAAHLAMTVAGELAQLPLSEDADVLALCARYGIPVPPESLPAAARDLRLTLARALEQALWLGDLRALLAEISEHVVAQGRRPLLLLEDVTAFQLLGDRILDYLLDLTSGHFDAVIGVTTGYERTQLAGATLAGDLTHIHHRLRARFVLTDEQGRAYGMEDDLVELARVYLAAAFGGGAPAAAQGGPPFDGLYPFTELSLRRAFSCLQEDGNPRQTPRLFLEHVVAAALLGDDPPPLTFDRSAYLAAPPVLFRADDAPDLRLRSLLRWYGEVGEEAVTLDARVADLWGAAVPPELRAGDVVRVSRAYVSQPPEAVARQDWQQELRELQVWLSSGGPYPSRETLKRGVEHALLHLGDPRSLGSPDALSVAGAHVYYARGDERLPIALGQHSGDQPSAPTYVKVQITGKPEERALLEELAYLELSGGDLSQVCRNLAVTLDWAQRHWDAYHGEVRGLLAQRTGGLSIEQLIWIGWRMASGLAGAHWDERASLRPYQPADEPYERVSPWSRELHSACYASGEAVVRHHEALRRLFIGAFTLRDTLLDLGRCAAARAASADPGIIERLARLPLPALRALPYRVRPLGLSLHDVIAPLQRYALALTQIDVWEALRADLADLRQREAHLSAQVGIDHALLRQQLLTLRWRCGEVGVTWKETWDAPVELLRSLAPADIEALLGSVRGAREAAEEHLEEGGLDVWSYQRIRGGLPPAIQHPYWAAAAALRAAQAELVAAARQRYRRGGGLVTGTRPYRQLLGAARAVWEGLADA